MESGDEEAKSSSPPAQRNRGPRGLVLASEMVRSELVQSTDDESDQGENGHRDKSSEISRRLRQVRLFEQNEARMNAASSSSSSSSSRAKPLRPPSPSSSDHDDDMPDARNEEQKVRIFISRACFFVCPDSVQHRKLVCGR